MLFYLDDVVECELVNWSRTRTTVHKMGILASSLQGQREGEGEGEKEHDIRLLNHKTRPSANKNVCV